MLTAERHTISIYAMARVASLDVFHSDEVIGAAVGALCLPSKHPLQSVLYSFVSCCGVFSKGDFLVEEAQFHLGFSSLVFAKSDWGHLDPSRWMVSQLQDESGLVELVVSTWSPQPCSEYLLMNGTESD